MDGHGWFGIKYIQIILSRDMNNPKVKLDQRMNFNVDGKTSYKWGPKVIGEGQDYEVGAWSAPRMVHKWYRGDVDLKWFSCRQIKPNLIQT